MEESAIRFREYQVHPSLVPFIKCVWSQESDHAIFDAGRERILPDSCVELVFHFRDPFRSHFADGTTALQPQAFVVGQMKRFHEIEPEGRMGLIAVRFYARSAHLFFQMPLTNVTAGIVDLSDIWQSRASELTEQIALAHDMAARVLLIEEALLELLNQNGHDYMVEECLRRIKAHSGQLRVAQLAKDLGLSSRQLTRRFHNTVGLTPKEFARVSRFLHVLRCLSEGQQRSLTETAVACGYFDQAHLNHEFREMAGMAPGELFTFPSVAF